MRTPNNVQTLVVRGKRREDSYYWYVSPREIIRFLYREGRLCSPKPSDEDTITDIFDGRLFRELKGKKISSIHRYVGEMSIDETYFSDNLEVAYAPYIDSGVNGNRTARGEFIVVAVQFYNIQKDQRMLSQNTHKICTFPESKA
jgi:hypothetical protein